MKSIKQLIPLCVLALLAQISPAHATEGGRAGYPDGAENFFAGALPPPGNYFINYINYYSADRLRDGKGNEVPINFHLTAFAEVARWVHVTPVKVMGGDLGMHVIVPLVDLNVSSSVFPGTRNRSVGDIVTSAFLGWHNENWHYVADLDIVWPTGSYEKTRVANVGMNSAMITPTFAVSYLSPDWQLGLKFMYDINMKNKDTDYKSGDAFHMDYLIARQVTKALSLGVSGYVFQQLASDELGGRSVANSKSRAYAFGPALSYQLGSVNFQAHYQHEFNVRNRPEGDKLWLKAVIPF
jgi:hypothetical protein